uniref:Uncharacterized protein n=1 Tax=Setaria italica TaxID=4555 RepID=K3YBR3_SETIT
SLAEYFVPAAVDGDVEHSDAAGLQGALDLGGESVQVERVVQVSGELEEEGCAGAGRGGQPPAGDGHHRWNQPSGEERAKKKRAGRGHGNGARAIGGTPRVAKICGVRGGGGGDDEQADTFLRRYETAPGYVSFEDMSDTAAFRDSSGRPPEAAISDPLVRSASRLYACEAFRRLQPRRQRSPGPLGTHRGSAMHGLVKKYCAPLLRNLPPVEPAVTSFLWAIHFQIILVMMF